MKKLLSIAAIGLFTLSAATTAVAQTVEDQIKFRQSGYAFAAGTWPRSRPRPSITACRSTPPK